MVSNDWLEHIGGPDQEKHEQAVRELHAEKAREEAATSEDQQQPNAAFSRLIQQAKERRAKPDYPPSFDKEAWPYSQSTKPTIGWSCPNCGRCYGPHVNSCTNCVPGAYYWPYPQQPSPWWQVPPTYPRIQWTINSPTTCAALPTVPAPWVQCVNAAYQTRLDA